MNPPIEQILSRYGIDGTGVSPQPLGHGLIHQTYLLPTENALCLQAINTDVFAEPLRLAANIEIVCEALEHAAENGGYPLQVARPLVASDGAGCVQVEDRWWRLTPMIADSVSIDRVERPQQAFRAARAFGCFSAALANERAAGLTTLLPGFHDLRYRLQQLEEAVQLDPMGRAEGVVAEVEGFLSQRELAEQIDALLHELPLRTTHNDTKVNNVLFHRETEVALAVIDLDTCMPGYTLHDFGDLARTAACSVDENEPDVSQVYVVEELLVALYQGFLEPQSSMGEHERESLWEGCLALPLLVGSRFLTDYILGDRYFPVRAEQQNALRARNQWALFEDYRRRENPLRRCLR